VIPEDPESKYIPILKISYPSVSYSDPYSRPPSKEFTPSAAFSGITGKLGGILERLALWRFFFIGNVSLSV